MNNMNRAKNKDFIEFCTDKIDVDLKIMLSHLNKGDPMKKEQKRQFHFGASV